MKQIIGENTQKKSPAWLPKSAKLALPGRGGPAKKKGYPAFNDPSYK